MEKSLLKTQYRTHRIEVKMTQIHRLRGLTTFREKVIYSSISKVYPNKPTELKKKVQVKHRLPSYFPNAWCTVEESSAVPIK